MHGKSVSADVQIYPLCEAVVGIKRSKSAYE